MLSHKIHPNKALIWLYRPVIGLVLRARGVDAWPSLSSLLAPGHDAFAKRYAVGEREWAEAVECAPAAVSSFLVG